MGQRKRTAVPVEPETAGPSVGTVMPVVDGLEALTTEALKLGDEAKRDLLSALIDSMGGEEPTVEDLRDMAVDVETSWRAQEPEVFAVGLIARVVGRTIDAKKISMELAEYLAGHTPARQDVLRSKLRLSFSMAVGVGQQAGSCL